MERKIKCVICGEVVIATGCNQRYCIDCGKIHRNDRMRIYMRSRRDELSD